MYLPVLRRIKLNSSVLVERALPIPGTVNAKGGDMVEPFTRLGMTKVCYDELVIPSDSKITKNRKSNGYVYEGEKIGTYRGSKILAPYNGFLVEEEGRYVFKQEDRDFWLLSGVWGEVAGVVKDTSVLIKTQCADISFAACTNINLSGELIVFPNPNESLVHEYLENFSKNVSGKILYIGNFLREDVMLRALELGVAGIMTGGTDKSTMQLAKQRGVFLGLFSGFGMSETPSAVFEILKNVSNRYVFIHGDVNLLRIPLPQKIPASETKRGASKSSFKYVKKGLPVMVLQKPYFGMLGVVDRVSRSSIFVKLSDVEESYEVAIPNIMAIE